MVAHGALEGYAPAEAPGAEDQGIGGRCGCAADAGNVLREVLPVRIHGDDAGHLLILEQAAKAGFQRLALSAIPFVVEYGDVLHGFEQPERGSVDRAVVHDDDLAHRTGTQLLHEAEQRPGRVEGGYDHPDHGLHSLFRSMAPWFKR